MRFRVYRGLVCISFLFILLFSATYSDDTTSDGAHVGSVGDALGATVAARGRLNSTGHDLNFHEFINRDHSKLE